MRELQWLAIAFFLFLFSCTKIETTSIGSGLIPPIDGVTTLDTSIEVVTNNYIGNVSDSSKVYKSDDHIIGVINDDPLSGKTTATAYFELKPTSYKYSFPASSTFSADSAVLILSYKGVYGDTMSTENWVVHEVTDYIKEDSAYPVSHSFETGTLLGSAAVNIWHFNDSVSNRFEKADDQIRIKLSGAFANKLMKMYDSATGHPYESDSLFRANFKGFAVGPAVGSPGNALVRINLLDTNTKLALYYNLKAESATNRDTAVSYFRFSTGNSVNIPVSASSNYIKRDYNGSQFKSFVNTSPNDSLVFIQTDPGTFATVKIPGLNLFPNSIIHRAELITLQAPGVSVLEPVLTLPRFLLLSVYDSTNRVKRNIPNDFIASTPSAFNMETFGGYVMERSASPDLGIVKAYTFDLTRYVQGIVTRKDSSYTLRLSAPAHDSLKYTPPYPANTSSTSYYFAPSSANNAADGRVRLGGGMHRSNPLRMRLRIIYSKI